MNVSAMELSVKAAVRRRDGYRCVDCKMTNKAHVEKYGVRLHVHRELPGHLGGTYTFKNCCSLCFPCHGKRHRKPEGPKQPDRHTKPKFVFHLPADLKRQIVAAANLHWGGNVSAFMRDAVIEGLVSRNLWDVTGGGGT